MRQRVDAGGGRDVRRQPGHQAGSSAAILAPCAGSTMTSLFGVLGSAITAATVTFAVPAVVGTA